MCTLEHRIVLFNQAAAGLLHHAGVIGLHRPIEKFFADDNIEQALGRLLSVHESERRGEIEQFEFEDFEIAGYEAHPHISAPVAV